MKKVSIIVPTYNQAGYLRSCLDALWFQSYENIEIILVNDGSTDKTLQVIDSFKTALQEELVSFASFYDENEDQVKRTYHRRYQDEGRSFKVISYEKNKGLASALNTGFKTCEGAYCTYIPSDDICHPMMFERLVDTLEQHQSDFAYADMFIIDDDLHILRRFSLPDYSFEACFQNWYLCGLAKLYKRSLHDQYGFYDENLLAHDHELFLRFAEGGAQFTHLNEVLMSVRDHESRQVDIHSPSNWSRLIGESKELVKRARLFSTAKNRGA